jgi:hypothetical protein
MAACWFCFWLFYDAASVSDYTILLVEGRWMIKWQEFGRWRWSRAHQCTIPALCWRYWGRPQEASIRTVPWPTVKLDILQIKSYSNVIGKVGWNKQSKHLRNLDKWTLFRGLFFSPHTCRPGSKNCSNIEWLQAFHTRK